MSEINFEDLISQKAAAEIRGISRAAINELVKRGRLQVLEIGGKKFLSRTEVESFEGQKGKALDKNRPSGRPPKDKNHSEGK